MGAAKTERPPEWELTLEAAHPLSVLRALWEGSAVPQPTSLDLRAGLPEGESLPCADPAGEVCRCRFLIQYAARTRLEQAAAGKPMEAGSLVLLSADRMAAWLLLFPPVNGGAELTTARLCRALTSHGVTEGIDGPLLCRIPQREDRYFTLFAAARGVLPVPGRDGAVQDQVPRTLESRPPAQGLGRTDYVSLNLVRRIAKGDVICRILPPEPGTPGRTVTGETLPAPAGKAAPVPAGRNTCLSEDGRQLLADRDGHVVFSGRSFSVNPVLHLEEKDLRPGSAIKFLGDVHIHGDLPGGASVTATGSIQIDGAVEGCRVEAGGSIVVSSGVQGQDQAVLYAHKQLYAKYLERCTVYARQGVLADCIIHCEVYSNGTVQACTGRGAVIGGTIRAAREIRAGTVGSKAELTTRLALGGLPCEEADRTRLQAELDRIARDMADWEQRPADPEREARLARLRLDRCVAQAKLDRVRRELGRLPSPARDPDGNPVRAVCGAVYPGTVIDIGGDSVTVDRLRTHCTAVFAGGRVGFQQNDTGGSDMG